MRLAPNRLAASSALLLLAACAGGPAAHRVSPLLGRPADLAAPDLQGREVRISEGRGRVRVVDFWATWCEPCLDQLVALEALSRAHAALGLQIYAITVDEDLAQVKAYLERSPVRLEVLWDRGGARLAERLDVERLPTTLLVDRSGRIRLVQEGYEPGHAEALDREVRRLLAE
jgi:cytochrome c biogenesis protein CcmG/thiol:disulfide interchange protein DsbE